MGQLFQGTVGHIFTITGTLRQNDIRMILDANFQDNSGMLFTKLDWLLIDDIIRTRRLSLLHKICNGCGPEYLSSYVNYVKSSHDYNTRTSRRNYLITPKCKKNSGLRTFHSSATRLWNKTEPSLRDTLSQKPFLGTSKGNKVQCLRKKRPVTSSELCKFGRASCRERV